MKSYLSSMFFILATMFLGSESTSALDVAYEGYFRSRANFNYNLDLSRSQKPQIRSYTDVRFQLNPTFFITDKLRVRSSLNFFDGNLGDNPLNSSPYSNPASSYDRTIDPGEVESTLGRGIAGSTGSVYGGTYSPDGFVTTSGLTPIQLRRVWGEFDLPFGTLKVGRMPVNFGLGLFYNAGDADDSEIGTSRDRIVWDTNLGDYYVAPGIGWIKEGALDKPSDDFMEYFFTFGRKVDDQDIGFSLSYNNQSASDSTVTTGVMSGRGSNFWAFGFYAQNKFSLLDIAGEVDLFSGKVVGKDLLAVNAAVKANWALENWSLLTEIGYASGTSTSEATKDNVKSVAFNRDYNVSLILFEEPLPGGKSLSNSAGTADTKATSPHSGAVSNAIYPRIKVGYDVASFFKPYLNIVTAYAATTPINSDARFYGIEYDIITLWPLYEHLILDFSFAHFIPGPLYNRFSQSHSTILLRGGLIARF